MHSNLPFFSSSAAQKFLQKNSHPQNRTPSQFNSMMLHVLERRPLLLHSLLLFLLCLPPNKAFLQTSSSSTSTTSQPLIHDLRNHLHSLLLHDPRFTVLLNEDTIGVTSDQNEQQRNEIQMAQSTLGRAITSFLEDHADPVFSGLTYPSSDCKKMLDKWMATCVFG